MPVKNSRADLNYSRQYFKSLLAHSLSHSSPTHISLFFGSFCSFSPCGSPQSSNQYNETERTKPIMIFTLMLVHISAVETTEIRLQISSYSREVAALYILLDLSVSPSCQSLSDAGSRQKQSLIVSEPLLKQWKTKHGE